MQKYFVNNNSDNLILFFTGWGCDETEFEHLSTTSDVLLLYNYLDLDFDFDFSKYKEINLIAYSAGVFASSVFEPDFEIKKKIALSGNPFLFDEKWGLSEKTQEVLCSVTAETADDFAKNYLVKTDAEWANFRHSQRTPESCREEFHCLKRHYQEKKSKIIDVFDLACFGSDDTIFDISAQKEFYGKKLNLVKNARHNIFFRIKIFIFS